ncbi:MAG TPA: ABC transporter permease subunit [Tepidisphaeraceae bacterium]|nr:ABC transporter permease subunit [Tepidisphaeraceae bacterium]
MSTYRWRKHTGSLRRLLIWALILALWEAAYKAIGWNTATFPSPMDVLRGAGELLFGTVSASGTRHIPHNLMWRLSASPLIGALAVSGARLVLGYSLSVTLGVALGIATWRWLELNRLLGPLFLGLQALTSVCWVPLALLLPGLGATGRGVIFVMVMGSTFSVAISLRDGLQAIPPIYPRAGQMLGARSWRLYLYVLIPASLPALSATLRLGFSFAWRSLMGAEVLFPAVSHGLGYLLKAAKTDVRQVIAVMIVMVLVGMAADRWFFAVLQRRIQARFGLA